MQLAKILVADRVVDGTQSNVDLPQKDRRVSRRKSSQKVPIRRKSSLWEMTIEDFDQIRPPRSANKRLSSKRRLTQAGRISETIEEVENDKAPSDFTVNVRLCDTFS